MPTISNLQGNLRLNSGVFEIFQGTGIVQNLYTSSIVSPSSIRTGLYSNIYVVPSGDTLGNTNITIVNLALAAYDTYQLYGAAEKLLLANGDSIQVSANANSAVTTVVTYTGI